MKNSVVSVLVLALLSPVCALAWPEPPIPLVYVSEGYRSPHDTRTFGGRDYDIADKNEAELAVQALTAFADARGVVASWYGSLQAAETAFWGHFAHTGEVDADLRNEFGYWLRKRYQWIDAFKGSTFGMQLQGGSAGNAYAKILELQFGVNDEAYFGFPADWRNSPNGPVAAAPDLAPGDAAYPVALGEWSRYSYMTACPCSPKDSLDPIERVGFLVSHPSGDIALGAEVVARLRRGTEVSASRIEQVTRDAIQRYGYVLRAQDVVGAMLDGDQDPINDMIWQAFDRYTRDAKAALVFVDGARRSARQDRIEASAFEYPWASNRPVLLGKQSIEAVEDCVVENWNDVKSYIWETNPDAVLRKTTDVYDKQSVPFRKSLGHVAAIACTSADGLADVRVDDFMEYFGLFD